MNVDISGQAVVQVPERPERDEFRLPGFPVRRHAEAAERHAVWRYEYRLMEQRKFYWERVRQYCWLASFLAGWFTTAFFVVEPHSWLIAVHGVVTGVLIGLSINAMRSIYGQQEFEVWCLDRIDRLAFEPDESE